jgi:hypothetical protein
MYIIVKINSWSSGVLILLLWDHGVGRGARWIVQKFHKYWSAKSTIYQAVPKVSLNLVVRRKVSASASNRTPVIHL